MERDERGVRLAAPGLRGPRLGRPRRRSSTSPRPARRTCTTSPSRRIRRTTARGPRAARGRRRYRRELPQAWRVVSKSRHPPRTPISPALRDQRDARARRVGLDRVVKRHRVGPRRDKAPSSTRSRGQARGLDNRLQLDRRTAGALHDGDVRRDHDGLRAIPRERVQPDGWTNWEAAFQKVREANTQGPLADLVVFVTDGDPTARNTASGDPVTGLVEGEAEALRRAAEQADLVKAQKSHVFALGVGEAVTKPTSARRLTAVSGFDQYPDTGFDKADYTLVEDFDDLAKALRAIALELCQASVTVTKMVDDGDGTFGPSPGWSSAPRSRPARGATPGCSRPLRPRPAHGLRRRTRTAWPPSSGSPTTPAREHRHARGGAERPATRSWATSARSARAA